jgi:hypothetical protein
MKIHSGVKPAVWGAVVGAVAFAVDIAASKRKRMWMGGVPPLGFPKR